MTVIDDAAQLMAEFLTRLDGPSQPYVDERNALPLPPVLNHYTTRAGLEGILGTQTFRFGDVFQMNDPSELRHGIGVGLDALVARATSAIPIPQLQEMADDLRRRLLTDERIIEIGHFFIGCFSKKENDLTQWRLYDEDGRGYMLGFDGVGLDAEFCRIVGVHAQTFHVDYRTEVLASLMNAIADVAAQHLPPELFAGLDNATRREVCRRLSIDLALAVVPLAAMFKHSGYDTEDEYRLMQVFRNDLVADVQTSPGGKRYLNFPLPRPLLRSVVAGPASDPGAVEFARDCLARAGFTGVNVSRSNLPYRP